MLAELLNRRLAELNMKPTELARATGLSDAAISKYLHGQLINPEAGTISRFAIALRLPYEQIIIAAIADQQPTETAPPVSAVA